MGKLLLLFKMLSISLVLLLSGCAKEPDENGRFPIWIVPGVYAGHWKIYDNTKRHPITKRFGGTKAPPTIEKVFLRPGMYSLRLGDAEGEDFGFFVDGRGNVESGRAGTAKGFGSSLIFLTTYMNVERKGFTGVWRITKTSGDRRILDSNLVGVIKNIDYNFAIAHTGLFRFHVDGHGFVSTKQASSAEGGVNKLTLKTATIGVKPANLKETWVIWGMGGPPGRVGEYHFDLVCGLNYRLAQDDGTGNYAGFELDENCVPTPETIVLRTKGKTLKFDLNRLGI